MTYLASTHSQFSEPRPSPLEVESPRSRISRTPPPSPRQMSLHNMRKYSHDPRKALFEIIQDSSLSLDEKNICFAKQLEKIKLSSDASLRLQTHFTTNHLTFRLCAPHQSKLSEISEVEEASMPFCFANASLSPQASLAGTVARLDFNSIVLPEALRTQINENDTYKKKAQVEVIQTLQEWVHGFTYSLDLPLPDAMPLVTADSYKIAAFVPVTFDGQQNITSWKPYVQGGTGPKMLFCYSASDDPDAHGSAFPKMTRRNNFVPMQQKAEKDLTWSRESLTFANDTFRESVTKIKKATMKFAVLPVDPIEPYPRTTISSPLLTAKNSTAKKSSTNSPPLVPYGDYNATGRHRVQAQSATHLQISPIPIDVSGLATQADLARYLQRLTRVVKKLQEPDMHPFRADSNSSRSRRPPARRWVYPISPNNVLQCLQESFLKLIKLVEKLIHSFFPHSIFPS